MMMDLDKVDVNDQRVQDLLALGTDATAEQIARLLDKHHGHMDNAAAALLDGNFQVDEPDTRGRQTTKAIAPALPPRRKQNSPVDNSRALVRIDTSNKNNLPAYDEDLELNKALALSLAEGGGGGGGDGGVGGDDDLPPLEPVPSGPVYGPHLDPRTNRGLDESTDHALRQALEASLNDGKNSLAADVYEELDIEQQVKVSDGRPTALRSSDPNSIFAPPVLQALLSIPHLLKRLKEVRTWPEGGDVESMLEAPWHDCEIIRELFTHAEHTRRSYLDVQQWATRAGWAREDVAHTPELMQRLTRALNLSIPNNKTPLFLSTLHDTQSPTPPPSLVPPHIEVSQSHQENLLYTIPLPSSSSSSPSNLIDILETQVSADRVGFASVPDALTFTVEGGRIGFPVRMWMDRWMIQKREFVEGTVMKRAKEIEVRVKGLAEEREKLVRHEGRDALADLRVCIKHFETTVSDGGDEKRRERNTRTLGKLKVILKDFEDRCEEIAKQTEDLKAESAGLWTRPELTTLPYDLQAVIIYDGLLGRAHLFSYVRRADKWWKVVDSTVSEVSEETVLSDSAGVHLGAGVVCLLYASAVGEGGKDKDDIKWPRKDRLKSQKLDEPFMAQLSPEVQARLAHQPVSESPSDEEEEFMDAEEMIVVAHDHTPAEDVVTGDVPDDVSMDEVVPPPAGVV